jgi:hypothetical protein
MQGNFLNFGYIWFIDVFIFNIMNFEDFFYKNLIHSLWKEHGWILLVWLDLEEHHGQEQNVHLGHKSNNSMTIKIKITPEVP